MTKVNVAVKFLDGNLGKFCIWYIIILCLFKIRISDLAFNLQGQFSISNMKYSIKIT